MQAFVVRPVILGLLGLIAAGLWGVPSGTRAGGPIAFASSCHSGAPETPTALVRRIHC